MTNVCISLYTRCHEHWIFGHYTGHIWGTSQRAWMGEDVELERGRSKNIVLFMTKQGKTKSTKTKSREDTE